MVAKKLVAEIGATPLLEAEMGTGTFSPATQVNWACGRFAGVEVMGSVMTHACQHVGKGK